MIHDDATAQQYNLELDVATPALKFKCTVAAGEPYLGFDVQKVKDSKHR